MSTTPRIVAPTVPIPRSTTGREAVADRAAVRRAEREQQPDDRGREPDAERPHRDELAAPDDQRAERDQHDAARGRRPSRWRSRSSPAPARRSGRTRARRRGRRRTRAAPSPISSGWWWPATPRAPRFRRFFTRDGVFGRGLAARFVGAMRGHFAAARAAPAPSSSVATFSARRLARRPEFDRCRGALPDQAGRR